MASLLSLPDEIIISIMLHMPTSDVIALSSAYPRFEPLLSDSRLWRSVDLTGCCHVTAADLRGLLPRLSARTMWLALRGHVTCAGRSCEPLLDDDLLRDLCEQCPSLLHLKLEQCVFNTDKMSFSSLPSDLLSLSMSRSRLLGSAVPLSGAGLLWPRLTQLEIADSPWLTSHSLLTLSKLPRLQRLCVRGCRRLGGVVAYSGIIGLLGFKQLRLLDVRRTRVDDGDVASFLRLPELNSLLLEPLAPSVWLDGESLLRSLTDRCSTQLKSLAIRRCHLSQLALRQLPSALPALTRLDITGCSLSVSQVRQLRAQMPACLIASDLVGSPVSSPSSPPPPRDEVRPNKRSSEFDLEPEAKRHRGEDSTATTTASSSGSVPASAEPCVQDPPEEWSWCMCEKRSGSVRSAAQSRAEDASSQDEDDSESDEAGQSTTKTPVVIVLNVFGAEGGGGQPHARLARPDEVFELLHAVEPNRDLPDLSPRSSAEQSGPSIRDPAEQSGSSIRDPVEQPGSSIRDPVEQDRSSIMDSVEHSGSSIRDPVEQDRSSIRDTAEQSGSSIRDLVEQSGSSIRDPVEHSGSSPSPAVLSSDMSLPESSDGNCSESSVRPEARSSP